jgi:methylated-DNA-[protein]-cysteine S-methyltransferase
MNSSLVRIDFDADVGRLSVLATARGVVQVALPGQSAPRAASSKGTPPDPAAEAVARRARDEILQYLSGRRRKFTVAADLAGVPPFHAKVLRACRRIPYGRTVTYGQLAAQVGRPRGARAVGQAMARNPVPLLVPCHRVVGGSGLGGYGGGLDLKRRLLALEGSPAARP